MSASAAASAGPTHFARRYTLNQQKALEKLHHSKTVFKYSTKLEDDEILLRIFEGIDEGKHKIPGLVRIKTAFDAARSGELVKLKRFLNAENFDARTHDDANGGNTILHYAAWGGDVETLQFIISHVRSTYGEQELQRFVNSTDTVCSRSTALMEACRSNVGTVPERLECIRILLEAGANATAQNASGENCLHIAARGGFLPVVRLLTTAGPKGALLATTTKNGKLQRPVDVAAARCGLKPPPDDSTLVVESGRDGSPIDHTKLAIYNHLRKVDSTARIRLMASLLERQRRDKLVRQQALEAHDMLELTMQIEDLSQRSWTAWNTQRAQALQLRREERDMIHAETSRQLPAHFELFRESAEGKARLARIERQLQQQQRTGRGGGESGESTSALEILRKEHDQERLREVENHFLTQNPVCPEWEEYLADLPMPTVQ